MILIVRVMMIAMTIDFWVINIFFANKEKFFFFVFSYCSK
jgi:hypothetical protein